MNGDLIYYRDGRSVNDVLKELEDGGGTITVDSALSTTSDNPVQNKAITTELNKKQNTLTIDSAMSSTSMNPVQNKVVNAALGTKQSTLVSGINIKTVNGISILGEGNLETQSGSIETFTPEINSSFIDTGGTVKIYKVNGICFIESNRLVTKIAMSAGSAVNIINGYLPAECRSLEDYYAPVLAINGGTYTTVYLKIVGSSGVIKIISPSNLIAAQAIYLSGCYKARL